MVDARVGHAASGRSAEEILDAVAHLLGDYSFLSRKCLLRVFKLCCLVIARPAKPYPVVDFALNDCSLPIAVVSACVKGVQSYVMFLVISRVVFFTRSNMEAVRDAINEAQNFMSSSFLNRGKICCRVIGMLLWIVMLRRLVHFWPEGKRNRIGVCTVLTDRVSRQMSLPYQIRHHVLVVPVYLLVRVPLLLGHLVLVARRKGNELLRRPMMMRLLQSC